MRVDVFLAALLILLVIVVLTTVAAAAGTVLNEPSDVIGATERWVFAKQ